MDAIITDGLYCPPSSTSGLVLTGAPITEAESTAPPAIPPPRITKAEDTSIPPARITSAEDTS